MKRLDRANQTVFDLQVSSDCLTAVSIGVQAMKRLERANQSVLELKLILLGKFSVFHHQTTL